MMIRGGTAIGVFLSFLLSVVPVFADDVRLIYPPKALAGRVLPFETPVPVVFSIANKGTVAEDLLVTTYFERAPEQQFGRRFWLPPNSSRIGWYLLTIPPGTESGDEVEAPGAQTLVLRRTSGGEAAILTIDGKRSADHFFRCSATSSPAIGRSVRHVSQICRRASPPIVPGNPASEAPARITPIAAIG